MPGPAPTIYLIAGCNGAGKTTFAKEFLPSVGIIRFLNADEIARGLSPLESICCRIQSRSLLLSELRELINRHEMFALESTLSGRTYVKLFEEAKQRGYKIELHFVWIPDVREAIAALLMGPDGGFVTGSDFLMDGGVTAAYWFGELAPELALSSSK